MLVSELPPFVLLPFIWSLLLLLPMLQVSETISTLVTLKVLPLLLAEPELAALDDPPFSHIPCTFTS